LNYQKLRKIFRNLTQKAIAYFDRDYEKIEEMRFSHKIPSEYLTPQTKKVFFIIVATIFILFFGYFTLQLKNYFSPPKVVILSPKTQIIKKGNAVNILGRTDKDAVITIAKERVFQSEEGIFEYKYPLHQGKNSVTIEVVGANGRKTSITEYYILETDANNEIKD